MKVQCTLNCTPNVVYVQLLGCSFFNQVYERIENCCIKGFKPGESEKTVRKEAGNTVRCSLCARVRMQVPGEKVLQQP